MKLLIIPLIQLICRAPTLARGAVTCIVLSLIATVAEIGLAVSMVPVLTSVGVNSGTQLTAITDINAPPVWLSLFVIAATIRSVSNWFLSVQIEHGTQEIVVSFQSRLYCALAKAHWNATRHIAPPTITSALQTQSYEAGYGFSNFIQAVSAALLVLGYLLSSAFIFPLVLPALVAALLLMWWLNRERSNRVYAQSDNYVGATTGLHQHYEDWVAISRIVSLGIDSKSLSHRFEIGAREAASHAVGLSRSYAATRVTYDMALVAGIVVGVPVAWWLETPPALLVFGLLAFVRVLPQAASIQVSYQGVVNSIPPLQAIERLAEQLEAEPVERPVGGMRLKWIRIELAGIGVEDTVRKGGRRWLIQDIGLGLEHGEWLALTGPTGAGKTTLAEVMLMLVRPEAGAIEIDGKSVDEELAGLWREQAGYVPQDVVLFDASIRDNLKLFVPDTSDDELKESLEKSAGEFVWERLPEGLDTRVGPGGRWLSGGERQRIGIARALLKKPGFLVLDEPTAALDGETQERLIDALGKLDHKMSVVLITHRPELLKLVDRVVEIVDGRIVRDERG